MSTPSPTAAAPATGAVIAPIQSLSYVAAVQTLLLCSAIPGLTGPVWWGAVVKERGYDIVSLGMMQTTNAVAGFIVGTLLAATLQRLDRRVVMVSCAMLVVGAELLTLVATSLPAFYAVRAIHSSALGVISILGLVYLGYTASPTKAYAWYTTVQTLIQAIALYALPQVSKHFGLHGVQWALAGTALLMALLSARMPRKAPVAAPTYHADGSLKPASPAPPILWIPAIPAVASWLTFHFYTSDFFAYSERFGNARQIDAETIGLVLAVTTAIGLPASLFVSWLGERIGLFRPVVFGAVFGVLSAALLLMPQFGLPGYWVAMAVFSLVWSFVYPFLLSLFMKIDPLGRLTVATQPIRMVINIGLSALTTAATAWWGLGAVAWLAGIGVALCPLMVWLALRLHARYSGVAAPAPSPAADGARRSA